MNVFELFAKLTLDTSEFDSGLAKAKSLGSAVGGGLKTAMDVGIKAVAAATSAIGAFGVTSVKTGMGFDSSMSQVAATMGKSMDEMANEVGTATVSVNGQLQEFSGNLRDYAQFMGANTAFSAKQAADALNYMALAGYDVQTSMDMLPNVLNLAAAGGMELADASDMVTDAQSALGLSLDETSDLVDKMAQASSKSNTSVSQLGEAILTIGGTAKNLAGGTTELSQALGLLADNGIKGAEGGTALRNILLNLTPKSKDAAVAMKEIGLNAYDAEGKMRPLKDIFTDLNNGLEGMTDEQKTNVLSTIFNKVDLKSVNALLATNVNRWDELGAAIDNSSGAAQKMADTQLDSLAGDVTLFKSALEGVQIALSDLLTPALRTFVEDATTGLSGITTALTNGDWSGAIDAVSQFLTSVLMRIVDSLPEFINMGMQLVGSIGQGILNNLPQIVNAAVQVVVMLVQGLIQALPQIVDGAITLIETLAQSLIESGPALLESGGQLLEFVVNGIANGLPKLLSSGADMLSKIYTGFYNKLPMMITVAGTMVNNVLQYILSNLPRFMQKGMELLSNISTGFIKNLPEITKAVVQMIAQLVATIAQNLPQILQQGIVIIGKLVAGLIQAIPQVVAAIPKIISTIVDTFGEYDWLSIGINIIKGIASGIANAAGLIADAARNAAKKAFDAAKAFLGIHSPSRLMRDQVGRYISEGIAVGIDQNVDSIEDSMRNISDLVAQPMSVGEVGFAGGSGSGNAYNSSNSVVINVYGAVGQNVNELAEIVSRKINAQVSRRGAAWA